MVSNIIFDTEIQNNGGACGTIEKKLHNVQLFCTLKQKSRITYYAKNLTVQRRKSPIKEISAFLVYEMFQSTFSLTQLSSSSSLIKPAASFMIISANSLLLVLRR